MASANDLHTRTDIDPGDKSVAAGAAASAAKARLWVDRRLKSTARTLGERYLNRLTGVRGGLQDSLNGVPDRIERAAQQTRLVLELLDDVRSGTYRELRWYSLPVAAAALLYAVSPADVVPDALPFIGVVDDVALVALAVRLLRNDLRAYCRFKGYPEDRYFEPAS